MAPGIWYLVQGAYETVVVVLVSCVTGLIRGRDATGGYKWERGRERERAGEGEGERKAELSQERDGA